ncbi:MAG: hypothetical protein K6356_05190 [Chloroflexus sp.]
MLTYEQLISYLIEHLEHQQITIAHTQEQLNLHNMGRSLQVICLPQQIDTGVWRQPPARAVISMHWPAEFTVASIHGQPIIDALNQIVAEQLHELRYASPMVFEVTYFLPLREEEQHTPDLKQLTTKVLDAFVDQPNLADNLEINFLFRTALKQPTVLVQLTVTRLFPVNGWQAEHIEDAIHTLGHELHTMLPRLAQTFRPENQSTRSDPEPGLDPQFYLRPPTA